MNRSRTIDYVVRQAVKNPDHPAIFTPDKRSITYKQLESKINNVSRKLLQSGLSNRRIAVVLPNGPDIIISFYAISSVAVFVPLNPGYSPEEFKNYMKLLQADALLMKENSCEAARLAALELSLPLLLLHTDASSDVGGFELRCTGDPKPADSSHISQDKDLAVVLHTSGTTGKPKIVPLTHDNLNGFIENTARSFNITEKDCCINVIPLFHVYGIVSPVLSSAAVGGSIICLESFAPGEFFRILDELSPTWYAASPAIHQAVAEYAERTKTVPGRYALKLVRSGGAPLPAKVAQKLEQHFGAIVVQGYGLTETSGMGACNPPMPGKIKHNSVGIACGCEIGIIDDQHNFLSAGTIGQIVIKGTGVTAGYENDEEANARAFHNGWFATGDEGYLDGDGYLFIIGRCKEMINRGGVKISPYEVEEALLQHPDILDTAVFAVPHTGLGEVPAAMAVLKPDSNATPLQLKVFLRNKIAQFKVPAQIIIIDKIPKGSTGKIQRKQLYETVLQTYGTAFLTETRLPVKEDCAPGNETEKRLAAIWQQLLNIDEIGIQEDFFELGGDSLLAAILLANIEAEFAVSLPLNLIVEKRTIEQFAEFLDRKPNSSRTFQYLVPIQTEGRRPSLFCIHAVDGDILSYRKLAAHLGNEQPVYGLWFNRQASGLQHPVQISALARCYIQEIQTVQPKGPYFIAGHSLGGLIAYEICRQLQTQNQEVALLAMFDTWLARKKSWRRVWKKTKSSCQNYCAVPLSQTLPYLFKKTAQELERLRRKLSVSRYRNHSASSKARDQVQTKDILKSALKNYSLAPYSGTITYFKSTDDPDEYSREALAEWSALAAQVQVIPITGKHGDLIIEPHVKELADKLRHAIQTAEK